MYWNQIIPALFRQFKQIAKDSDSGSLFPRGLLILLGIWALRITSWYDLRLQAVYKSQK